jgi:6-aminohexanoate-oligomer endohydrolase
MWKWFLVSLVYYAMTFSVLAKPSIDTNLSYPGSQLTLNFPNMHIGTAEYVEGETGVSVFYFPKGAIAAVDFRGGSIGTFFTQTTMQCGYAPIDAIVLSGGSILGLESVTGVLHGIFELKQEDTNFKSMPLVTGVSIYDFDVRSPSAVYPDKALGMAAFKSAVTGSFPLGRRGAGRSATVGKLLGNDYQEYAGQGGAFSEKAGIKLAVFTVLNAVGVVVDEQGNTQHGLWDKSKKRHLSLNEAKEQAHTTGIAKGNTTLTLLVTNLKLKPLQLSQLGKQVHNSMGRWIQPFGALKDGDVFYTVSTQEIEVSEDFDPTWVGLDASELVKEAIFSAFQISLP